MWSIPSHLVKSRETVVLETALVAHTGCMFFFLLLFFVCSIWQKQTTTGPVMGAGRVLIAPFFFFRDAQQSSDYNNRDPHNTGNPRWLSTRQFPKMHQ